MNWYYFEWDIFVTDELMKHIVSTVDVSGLTTSNGAEIKTLLTQLLTTLGGSNVTKRTYTEEERTNLAINLLHNTIYNALSSDCNHMVPGYVTKDAGNDSILTVSAFDRVNLNYASAAEIESLPDIGPTLARRIVEERRRKPFKSLEDLNERISGIGDVLAKRLAKAVTFMIPPAREPIILSRNFDSDWKKFVDEQNGATPHERIVQALELLLMRVQLRPNPATPILLDEDVSIQNETRSADNVTVLLGSQYYRHVKELLDGAIRKIDVCMFHIAMPGPNHPTEKLLASLKDAHQRGVEVRVLMDQDRKDDPYLSTVINSPAVRYLRQAGIQVRQDTPEKLLHSKFILIDENILVIGSHNWTAGSYFNFDDLSLVIRSGSTSIAQIQRFDSLWENAVDN